MGTQDGFFVESCGMKDKVATEVISAALDIPDDVYAADADRFSQSMYGGIFTLTKPEQAKKTVRALRAYLAGEK